MKTALIPPIPELSVFGVGDFHLILTHLLDTPQYWAHYYNQRNEHGSYLVLDNSAHEHGEGEDALAVMNWAWDLQVQEVVVPDHLADAASTVEKAIQAHEVWFEGSKLSPLAELNPNLMYVPQGQNSDEWVDCLDQLIGIHLHTSKRFPIRRGFVIGISKDYETWDGGILKLLIEDVHPRMRNLQAVKGVWPRVHLLGWGRQLWKLKEIAKYCPWIRSTDSAKPFVYALSNKKLNPDAKRIPIYPTRPDDYFSRSFTAKQLQCATHNVELFFNLAQGR